MYRRQTATMREVMSEHERCELCGSSRSLEAHHIIPLALGGTDEKENILCVCKKCHALLTPNSLLTRMGLAPYVAEERFYKHFNELSEAGERYSASDVFDYLDENVFPIIRKIQCENNVLKQKV